MSVRALGDKSELPLLPVTPLLSESATDSTRAMETNAQCCDVESELTDLAISATVNAEDNEETGVGSHDVIGAHADCENFVVNMSQLEPVASTAADVEHSTADAAADTYLTTNPVDVGSDSKGELELHQNLQLFICVLICLHFCCLTVFTLNPAKKSVASCMSWTIGHVSHVVSYLCQFAT